MAGFTALVADDSRLMRQMERTALSAAGFTVIDEAVDGEDALGKLMAKKYDLVILDYVMPKLTGAQALKELHEKTGPNKDTPVLMVTGESSREKVMEIARLKVSGYMVKPFTLDKLEARVRQFLPPAAPPKP
ncbi:MAG: response regulator [Nitrospinae bacterium]|nr:response regulator [Nitrospinota bacterium]